MDIAEEAAKAWVRPRRGDGRMDITIDGSRVWVSCKGHVVKVVIHRDGERSQVETDLVKSVEVSLWRQGSEHLECPPLDGGRVSTPARKSRSRSG
jgi:hypothetical protein